MSSCQNTLSKHPNRRLWVFSLLPEILLPFKQYGVVGKLLSGERRVGELGFELLVQDLRELCDKGFKGMDDAPYGGGAGMILRADRLLQCLEKALVPVYEQDWREKVSIIFTSARGIAWNHQSCAQFAQDKLLGKRDLVFICGRYEGIDERFINQYVDYEYSMGDFVLSGGELAVMTMLDSALRLLPGVLSNGESLALESFDDGLLEGPQYTRPREFEGVPVPEVLLSGHDLKIKEHNQAQRLKTTQKYRKDLCDKKERP